MEVPVGRLFPSGSAEMENPTFTPINTTLSLDRGTLMKQFLVMTGVCIIQAMPVVQPNQISLLKIIITTSLNFMR